MSFAGPHMYQPLVDPGSPPPTFGSLTVMPTTRATAAKTFEPFGTASISSIPRGASAPSLHVNGRRLAGNGHGSLKRSDPQLGIDGGRESDGRVRASRTKGPNPGKVKVTL